jgi:peptidoglycan/LPS O-acetylase OafA/YrhL
MVLVLHFIGDAVPTNKLEAAVAWAANYGAYGVDLFFVLSGFLITGILFDARSKPHYFRNFYVRRALRIFPLYYLVLAGLFLVLPWIPRFQAGALSEIRPHQAWAWLYGVNFYNGIRGGYSLPYLDHFWSLSVEEHFYFVWPLLVWFLGRRPRALLVTSLVVGLGALVARISAGVAAATDPWLLFGHPITPVSIFVLTPFRLDGLALGGFLAILARQPGGLDRIVRSTPRVALGAGALLVTSFAWNRFTDAGRAWMAPIRGSLILILLAALLLRALTAPAGSLSSRFFRSAPMTWLGVYSYGLYVYHHFFSFYFIRHQTEFALAARLGIPHGVAVLLQAAVGAAASCLVAWASYQLFEKRCLALKERFTA